MKNKNNKSKQKDETSNVPLTTFIIISLCIVLVQIVGGFLVFWIFDKWEERASFGDMFGAIGVLFSGLAFAGVIYAILLQRRELELQRRELAMTREELERSAVAQEKSEAALVEQSQALLTTARLTSLNFIPAINCQIVLFNGKPHVSLSNLGSNLAFDVDALILGVLSEDNLALEEFVEKYVEEKYKNQVANGSDENDFYSLSDRVSYAIFPQKRKVLAPLNFPVTMDSIYILLQFRDIQSNNYHYLYWFYKSFEANNNQYRMSSIDPKAPSVAPRIEMAYIGTDMKRELIVENNGSIPEYI